MSLALALLSGARVLALDGAVNGVDAPRALSIITSLRASVLELHLTAVVSLESPTPEVFALFDSLILLAQGRMLYHGPPSSFQLYLGALGFILPDRMGACVSVLEPLCLARWDRAR